MSFSDKGASYEQLVTTLSNGMSHRLLYYSQHPRVRSSAEDFETMLAQLLAEDGKEAFFLGVVDGRLVHEGRLLLGPTLLGKRVVSYAEKLKCGGFLFRRGTTAEEICEFFALCSERKDVAQSLETARGVFAARGIRRIELSPPYEEPEWFGQFLFDGNDRQGTALQGSELGENPMIPVYQSLFETVETAHGLASCDSAIDIDGVRTVSEQMLKSAKGNFKDILQLVQYPDYDSYTVGHSVRVALLAVQVGHFVGAPPEFLLELASAGLLHDVGKAKIPDEILYKPARLDEEERRIMSRHTVLGAEILLENREAGPLAVGCAFGHHLRFDGGGYPWPRRWTRTSRVTRLVQVCDVFEALTAVRPYKPDLTPRRAYELMLQDCHAYDPGAFEALVGALGFYPPGTRVRLTSGEEGRVVAAGIDPSLPRVDVTHGPDGKCLPPGDVHEIELCSSEAGDVSVLEMLRDDERVAFTDARPADPGARVEHHC